MTSSESEVMLVGTPVREERFAAVDDLRSLALIGRAQLVETAVRLLRLGGNVLLFGDEGSGRTAVLHEVVRRLHSEPRTTVAVVDGSGIVAASDLLALTLQTLGVAVRADVGVPFMLGRVRLADGESRVIAVDDVEVTASQDLFGRWRRHLWRLGARWVAVGTGDDPTPYLDAGSDALWEDGVLEVPPLDQRDGGEMVARYLECVGVDGAVPDELLRSARGSPRELLRHARAVALERINDRDAGRDAPSLSSAWEASVEESPRYELSAQEMQFITVLESHGGRVSLADPAVKQALGWSYGKAHGVAKRLVQRGVLERADVPGDLGRPRVVYSACKPS